jgi:hypothetical protein
MSAKIGFDFPDQAFLMFFKRKHGRYTSPDSQAGKKNGSKKHLQYV